MGTLQVFQLFKGRSLYPDMGDYDGVRGLLPGALSQPDSIGVEGAASLPGHDPHQDAPRAEPRAQEPGVLEGALLYRVQAHHVHPEEDVNAAPWPGHLAALDSGEGLKDALSGEEGLLRGDAVNPKCPDGVT